jgi:hypothetical protein
MRIRWVVAETFVLKYYFQRASCSSHWLLGYFALPIYKFAATQFPRSKASSLLFFCYWELRVLVRLNCSRTDREREGISASAAGRKEGKENTTSACSSGHTVHASFSASSLFIHFANWNNCFGSLLASKELTCMFSPRKSIIWNYLSIVESLWLNWVVFGYVEINIVAKF